MTDENTPDEIEDVNLEAEEQEDEALEQEQEGSESESEEQEEESDAADDEEEQEEEEEQPAAIAAYDPNQTILEKLERMEQQRNYDNVSAALTQKELLLQHIGVRIKEAFNNGDEAAYESLQKQRDDTLFEVHGLKQLQTAYKPKTQEELFASEKDAFLRRQSGWYGVKGGEELTDMMDDLYKGYLAQGKTHVEALRQAEAKVAKLAGTKQRKAPVLGKQMVKPKAAASKAVVKPTYKSLKPEYSKAFNDMYRYNGTKMSKDEFFNDYYKAGVPADAYTGRH